MAIANNIRPTLVALQEVKQKLQSASDELAMLDSTVLEGAKVYRTDTKEEYQFTGGDSRVSANWKQVVTADSDGILNATFIPRREDTATLDSLVGVAGEIATDSTKDELRVFDGTTAGGIVIGPGPLSKTSANGIIQSERNNTASSYGAVAIGSGCTASGNRSVAIGSSLTASGNHSFATGYYSTASGESSFAAAYGTASGGQSFAMGSGCTASGYGSFAKGYGCAASGDRSVALGYYTSATGHQAFAMGKRCVGRIENSFTLGSAQNVEPGDAQTVLTNLKGVVDFDTTAFTPLNTGAATHLTLPEKSAWVFHILLAGITQNAAKSCALEITSLVRRDTTGVSVISPTTFTKIANENLGTIEAKVVANTGDNSLRVEVQDTAGNNGLVRFAASIRMVEVLYA